ncbi:hypothetical protein HYW74_04775 [Candidatus Pacearchaeota archaeon]|nr:hypothetical protein [Candidatus Pacearchaeota archaeon]
MKNKEWAIIIAVVLVVAVAVSLITANITGNAVFKAARGYGPNAKEVYTKAEIDDKINSINSQFQSRCYVNSVELINNPSAGLSGEKTLYFGKGDNEKEYRITLVTASSQSQEVMIKVSGPVTTNLGPTGQENVKIGSSRIINGLAISPTNIGLTNSVTTSYKASVLVTYCE